MSDYIVPPCLADITILEETADYWVINKPSGLLSVPGKLAANVDSVQTRLREHYEQAYIVHRLDLDTSGIMVVAKHKDALRKLNHQFEHRQTYKEYTAVVWGVVATDHSQIAMPLICDWPNRPKQKVCYDSGKPALTDVTVIERDRKQHRTRLLLKPLTGRSHQLRVHTAALHHPILGCDFYAHEEALKAADRLLLHAHRLDFDCPTDKRRISINHAAPF